MRRLRAVAVIVLLAVIWLGYSVAREIAAERSPSADTPQVALQDVSSPRDVDVPKSSTKPSMPQSETSEPERVAESATLVPSAEPPILVSDDASPASPGGEVTEGDGPSQSEPKPSLQAWNGGYGGAPGRHALGGGSFGSGGGGGGAGGAGSQGGDATELSAGSGDGRPKVLGHRLGADNGEPDGSSDSKGSIGSNGGSSSSGTSASSGNGGSEGSGSSNGIGDSGGNRGSSASNGWNNAGSNEAAGEEANGAKGGSAAGNGTVEGANEPVDGVGGQDGDDGGGAGATNFAAAAVEADEVPQVPEPGTILFAIGVAAAFARRRAR